MSVRTAPVLIRLALAHGQRAQGKQTIRLPQNAARLAGIVTCTTTILLSSLLIMVPTAM